jgi:hypothetical protein
VGLCGPFAALNVTTGSVGAPRLHLGSLCLGLAARGGGRVLLAGERPSLARDRSAGVRATALHGRRPLPEWIPCTCS